MAHDTDEHSTTLLPLLNARTWALGFLAFAVVVAVVFSQFLVDFIASAY